MEVNYNNFSESPKGLCFDVFGTVVNWRKTVTLTLLTSAKRKTISSTISPEQHQALSRLSEDDWSVFVQQWRDSYMKFTRTFIPGQTEWKDIDTHHFDSLVLLLKQWDLEDVYTKNEIKALSMTWHFLEPWPDSSPGIQKLGEIFVTSTLSNGNLSLLRDLNESGKLGFRKIQSAEDFEAYKPNEKVYRGACKVLGFEEGEVAMVAAHLADLKAARSFGMKTVYVERKEEEAWKIGSEEFEDAKGWVDMWVREDEGGMMEVARRFGIVKSLGSEALGEGRP